MNTYLIEWSCVNMVQPGLDPNLAGKPVNNNAAETTCSGRTRLRAENEQTAINKMKLCLNYPRRAYEIRISAVLA